MKKRYYFFLLAIIMTILPTISGYAQVNKVYQYTYDLSGNRLTRVPVLTTQSIALQTGWNIISANVLPEDMNLKHIFQPLIDTGMLSSVMDESGNTIQNYGAFGGWKNTIGDIQATEGYKVNVTTNCTLQITGDQIALPLTIPLAVGWNIISFPQTTGINGMTVVQPWIDNGTVKKVMDEAGRTIENFGAFGGWKNNIGDFIPGKGYKVNALSATSLVIYPSYTKSASIPLAVGKPEHFSPAYIGNGYDHMNINIVDLTKEILEPGDEISAYDEKICVGTAKIMEENLNEKYVQLIVSANDDKGGLGFTKGKQIKLKLWKKATNTEYSLKFETIKGVANFEKHESSFIRLKSLEKADQDEKEKASKTEESQQDQVILPTNLPNLEVLALSDKDGAAKESLETSLKCYPNPLTDDVTIEFYLPTVARVNISIYNSTGKLIRTITDENVSRGTSQFNWNRTDETGQKVASGLYLCKLQVDNHSFNKKLIVR